MKQKPALFKAKTTCAICDYSKLSMIAELPSLPLTGLYVEPIKKAGLPSYMREGIDQAFMFCPQCTHGQLLNVIDYQYLYDDSYTHRGSKSPIATSGNEFFANFLKKVAGNRTFKRAIDIGCNDLYLLKKIEPLADALVGVDAIWKGKDHRYSSKIAVLGGFIEEVNYVETLGGRPDLVVSAHTFEHIQDPKPILSKIVKQADLNALFVIEVPSFDNLLRNHRFDQVFHQHLQYYSLASFTRLLEEIGCEEVEHAFNYGFWGGTMLVAFKKAQRSSQKLLPSRITEEEVRTGYAHFSLQLARTLANLQYRASPKIYGYGAAQMLPILAYHMKSDFSFMHSILDDNETREGLAYPHLSCIIQRPQEGESLEDADVLVTALDSARSILKRILQMKAQRVVIPLNTL